MTTTDLSVGIITEQTLQTHVLLFDLSHRKNGIVGRVVFPLVWLKHRSNYCKSSSDWEELVCEGFFFFQLIVISQIPTHKNHVHHPCLGRPVWSDSLLVPREEDKELSSAGVQCECGSVLGDGGWIRQDATFRTQQWTKAADKTLGLCRVCRWVCVHSGCVN